MPSHDILTKLLCKEMLIKEIVYVLGSWRTPVQHGVNHNNLPSETPRRLLLNQKSTNKLLLERIGMKSTPSTELYNKLIEADLCWHKVDDFYFAFCPPGFHKLLCIKEWKELLEPTLDHISHSCVYHYV